eukprot:1774790-Pleurochrysis_carterae.AAC.1
MLCVGLVVGHEKRCDAIGIEGSVVVVVVVVHPQLVGAIGVVLCVGCVDGRAVMLFRFVQFRSILIFHTWVERGCRSSILLRAIGEARCRTWQRSKRDVVCVGFSRAQSTPFRRDSKQNSSAIGLREKRSAGIVSVRLALRSGYSESASVGALGFVLLGFARAVTVPVLTAAVTACAVLERPFFLECVGFVVALGIR